MDAKKLAKVLESEDTEKFANLVGFGIFPITPTDLDGDAWSDE